MGGKGTRLRPLVSDVPKPLAIISDEPFLYLLLRDLRRAGIKKVVLLTGYLHEKFIEICGNGSQFDLEIIYSKEDTTLGTAGALLNAKQHLIEQNEFILLNGDTYFECSINHFINLPINNSALGVIGLIKSKEQERYGSIQFNDTTRVIESFNEKTGNNTKFINAGIYKLSSKILNFIPERTFCSLEKDIFPQIISKGLNLVGYVLEGSLWDIGVPESYVEFNINRMLFHSKLNIPLKNYMISTLKNLYIKELLIGSKCD